MALRPIIRFPNDILRQPAAPVQDFDAALTDLAQDLTDTMRAAPGIGITAPHIGIAKRIAVIELDPKSGLRVYVNPVVIDASPDLAHHMEGSVSMPGVTETVERPARVTVRYQTLEGDFAEETAEGLLSVCLQHEIDQLDGIFWIQRVSRLKRDRVVKRFEKLERNR